MALLKDVITPYGFKATYHRIAAVQHNYVDGGGTVTIYSYIDEANRRNKATTQPIGAIQVSYTKKDYAPLDTTNNRAALYAYVKQYWIEQEGDDAVPATDI